MAKHTVKIAPSKKINQWPYQIPEVEDHTPYFIRLIVFLGVTFFPIYRVVPQK